MTMGIALSALIDAIQKQQPVYNAQALQHVHALLIIGVASLQNAQANQVGFINHAKYQDQLTQTQAGAVLVTQDLANKVPQSAHALIVDDPYLAFACVSQLFAKPKQPSGIHPSAIVDSSAQIGKNVCIGAFCVIGAGVVIGDDTTLGAHVVVEDDVLIGNRCTILHHVVIGYQSHIGDDCTIHAGASIGAEGFGFAPKYDTAQNTLHWHKIAQLGRVHIGNRVRIGAQTCIDRGAIDDTVIADDVIIDNLVQIAHNVQIGQGTAIAAMAGIAGSSIIGKRCIIGGAVGIAGHLLIADGVTLTGRTFVTKSITQAGVYSSGTVAMPNTEWRRAAAKFRQMGKKTTTQGNDHEQQN